MRVNWRLRMRELHRMGAVFVALPFLVVIATGMLLQLKKDLHWIQPRTTRGVGTAPEISFERILDAARAVPEANVTDWGDIDRLDVRPGLGIVKVQTHNHWEVQVDLQTADVKQVAFRRSDVIESLHDGSWFHPRAKLLVFTPMAVVLLGLWLTGIYLFVLPHAVRRDRRRRNATR